MLETFTTVCKYFIFKQGNIGHTLLTMHNCQTVGLQTAAGMPVMPFYLR